MTASGGADGKGQAGRERAKGAKGVREEEIGGEGEGMGMERECVWLRGVFLFLFFIFVIKHGSHLKSKNRINTLDQKNTQFL